MVNLEGFVPVKGYEGFYLINNKGEIYSIRVKRLLKPQPNGTGYLKLTLTARDGSTSQPLIHRLVLMSFTPEETWKEQGNHLNGVKTNNFLDNLAWVDQFENCQHSYHVLGKTRSPNKGKFEAENPSSKAIVATNLLTGEKLHFPSIKSVANLGYGVSSVAHVLHGRRTEYRGFKWAFGDLT